MVDLPSCSVEWVVLVVLMLLKVCPCCPWKEDIFASFLERMVRYRDVQEGEKHRPDTDMFGESTTSSLDVGCLSGYESMSIVRPM